MSPRKLLILGAAVPGAAVAIVLPALPSATPDASLDSIDDTDGVDDDGADD